MRRAVTVLVATLVVASGPLAAWGHEGGISDARPRPGEVVGGTLAEVQLLFGRDVLTLDDAVVRVFDPLDRPVDVQTTSLPVSSLLQAEIRPPSEPGSYLVEYEIMSVSGQVHTGRYVFLFDPGAAPVAPFSLDRLRPGWPVFVLIATIVSALGCIVAAWLSRNDRAHVDVGPGHARSEAPTRAVIGTKPSETGTSADVKGQVRGLST